MRKYVSLETQEIQKNADRRHRNEQNRMKNVVSERIGFRRNDAKQQRTSIVRIESCACPQPSKKKKFIKQKSLHETKIHAF